MFVWGDLTFKFDKFH